MASTHDSVTLLKLVKDSMSLDKTCIEWVERRVLVESRFGEEFQRVVYHVHARPYLSEQCRCPKCRRPCVRDGFKSGHESSWRAPDLNGIPVFIDYRPQRTRCEEHGEINEWVPWADGDSRLAAESDNEVAWLARRTGKVDIAAYLHINWRTVGNCLRSAHDRLEPDVSDRIHDGLEEICVDETSYSVGHQYITVVYDMRRNRVVWVHRNHGKKVFEEFCELLTPEERENIRVVAGDGARWIDDCVGEHYTDARRCVDFFHVCEWANEALDRVRVGAAAKAKRVYDKMRAEFAEMESEARRAVDEALRSREEALAEIDAMPRRGRPSNRKRELLAYVEELDRVIEEGSGTAGDAKGLSREHQEILRDIEASRRAVKGAKHALGHAPENRTENQDKMIELTGAEQPDLYRAYQLKERLRLILHLDDAEEAEAQLDEWVECASSSGLRPMGALSEKIARHRQNILNSVELGANSAKSESCNTTIKAMIKLARGLGNLDNMFALTCLKCSDIVIPLNRRPQPSAAWSKLRRDEANGRRRRRREEERRAGIAVA